MKLIGTVIWIQVSHKILTSEQILCFLKSWLSFSIRCPTCLCNQSSSLSLPDSLNWRSFSGI